MTIVSAKITTADSISTGMISANVISSMLREVGTVYIDEKSSFLMPEEWDRIEAISFRRGLPYEHVLIGDADEPNDVDVGRFMTDVDEPQLVNKPLSTDLLAMIGSPARMRLYEEAVGESPLYIRRVQVNRMHQRSFVGLHLDKDSNPDYEVSIVLQLGQAFSGGDFIVHHPTGETRHYAPKYRSIIISRCDLPHEVTTVTSGTRTSLVYFLSRQSGANRRRFSN